MLAHLSRLFKHSLFYGLSETISRGTGFVLVFIYARILDDSDIGIRTLVYGAASFITLFYTFGIDNAFLRYFMDKEYKDERSSIVSTAFVFTLAMGLFFFICALFFSTPFSNIMARSPSHRYIVRLIFGILLFDTAVIYPTLILRAEKRLVYYSIISLSRFVLFITLNIVFVWYLQRGVKGIFEANLISVFIIAVVISPVYKTYLSGFFSGNISLTHLKRMLLFGIPTVFTLFFMRIIDISDRYLIEHFIDKAAVGKYHIAYTLGMVGIMVFVNSFRTAWQPFFLSMKDNPDAGKLFSKVATYYAVFICMVYLGMTLFRREIFHIYAPEHSPGLSAIIPFVALAYLLYGFYIIMIAGIFIREKTKYLPLAPIVGALLNVGLNLVFIPRFGIIGAAITTVIAYCAMVFILFIIAHNVYRVHYEYGRLVVVFIITAMIISVSYVLDVEGAELRFLLHALFLLVPPAVYWFSGFLRPEEIRGMKKIITGLPQYFR